jgi:hypothetical protein
MDRNSSNRIGIDQYGEEQFKSYWNGSVWRGTVQFVLESISVEANQFDSDWKGPIWSGTETFDGKGSVWN